MRTPFDTALRTRRRAIDHLRIAIHAEATRLHEIDRQNAALERELAEEYQACAQSWAISSEAFIRRRMAQQAQLVEQRLTVSGEIDRLRREAVDAYGSQHVLESAAEAFRTDRRRCISRAEQRDADDLCAARIAALPSVKADPAIPRLPAR